MHISQPQRVVAHINQNGNCMDTKPRSKRVGSAGAGDSGGGPVRSRSGGEQSVVGGGKISSLAQHEDNGSESPVSGDEKGSGYSHRTRTRRKRWRLLETTWKESSIDRCRACRRWRADKTEGYEVCVSKYDKPDEEGTERKAYVGNIQTCRSSWGCPVCAAKIRQKRAEQIAKATAKHLDDGGGIEMLMLTMPHDREDDLEGLLRGLKSGWGKVSKGYARRRDWEEFGVAHYVRSLDLTWSPRAGWHPHYHVVLFTDEPLSEKERADFEHRIYTRWAEGVTSKEYRRPNRKGVNMKPIKSKAEASTVSYYTAEGVLRTEEVREGEEEDRMRVGWEMSRHDLKSEGSGWSPWRILERLDALRRRIKKSERKANDAGGWSRMRMGEVARQQCDEWRKEKRHMASLWHEYEQATKGKRSIQPSRGLWKDYGVTEGDLEDEELADEEQNGEVAATLDEHTMEWVRRVPGGYASLLEAAEDGTYILRTPSGRIEATGEKARKAGADAVGLSAYIRAVQRHAERWRTG